MKHYNGITTLFFFALFLAPQTLCAVSFDKSQTSLTSDLSSTNSASLSAQNANTNAYSTTASNSQNYQQRTSNSPAISTNEYPQEININTNYPKNIQQSIPSVTFSGDQGFGVKGLSNKGSLVPGSREYGKIIQKDVDIKVPDMSFLGKNLIRAPEDKPQREEDGVYFPGVPYDNEDIAGHYESRKEEDVAYIYNASTYR